MANAVATVHLTVAASLPEGNNVLVRFCVCTPSSGMERCCESYRLPGLRTSFFGRNNAECLDRAATNVTLTDLTRGWDFSTIPGTPLFLTTHVRASVLSMMCARMVWPLHSGLLFRGRKSWCGFDIADRALVTWVVPALSRGFAKLVGLWFMMWWRVAFLNWRHVFGQ